jgi:ribosomal protein S18 acetylase RimI-like enzyme
MSNKNQYTNRIIPLEREKWEGHKFAQFHYTSNYYYDVEIKREDSNFSLSLVKKPFTVPFEQKPDDFDVLFQPWWEDVKAWGIFESERLIAVIETAEVGWSNRLRVTELWVDDAYHRKGIASALMDVAVKRAKDENRRAIILETQSCNANAIAFYLAYGFTLIGFDSCAYQNNDLERKEVRMEFGILFN